MSEARVDRIVGRSGGFTLAELMVSMTIGSVLLLVVLAVVQSGGDGYSTATQRVDANVEARAALTTLADDLSSVKFDDNFVLKEVVGSWSGSELSFLTLKPPTAQDRSLALGDLCFVHYYTAVTRQLEGTTGPYSRKLYRRLVSSRAVMDVLRNGGNFETPVVDPNRPEDEAVAFNVVQFLVTGKVEADDGTVVDWTKGNGEPDFVEVTLRVTDNKTAALFTEQGDWEATSDLARRMLGTEADPESGQRLRTYHVEVPVL